MTDRSGDVVWVYARTDRLYDWRRVAANGEIVSTSGGQGYTDEAFCREMAEDLNPGVEIRRWPGGEVE